MIKHTSSTLSYSMGSDGSPGRDVAIFSEEDNRGVLIDGKGAGRDSTLRKKVLMCVAQLLAYEPKVVDNIPKSEFDPNQSAFAIVEWNLDGTIDYAIRDTVLVGWSLDTQDRLKAEVIYMSKGLSTSELDSGTSEKKYLFFAAISDGYDFLVHEELFGKSNIEGIIKDMALDAYPHLEEYEKYFISCLRPLTSLLQKQLTQKGRLSSGNSKVREIFDTFFGKRFDHPDDYSILISESPQIYT